MFAAAMEMVNVVSAQTGGAPRHPKEAAESKRDYPEQGQAAPGAAAAAADGSQLRAAPEEPPHPPVHGEPARGVLGRSSSHGKGGKLWTEARSHTRTRSWLQLTAPGEPSLPFGKAYEDPFLQVFFYPKQSET